MKEPQIVSLLTPVVTGLDLELEAVDLVPAGKRRLLRIVLDGDGANGRGPTLDDIAEATRAISAALDEADVTGSSPYTLEVSSRGVGRPLELPRHWRRNVSRLVSVTTTDGTRLTGRIVSTTEESVLLDVAGRRSSLPLADVTRALVEVELNRPSSADDLVGVGDEEDLEHADEEGADDLDDEEVSDDDADEPDQPYGDDPRGDDTRGAQAQGDETDTDEDEEV